MRITGLCVGLVLVAATVLAFPSAAPAGDRVIATSGAFVSPVEASGGRLVWGEVAVGRSSFRWFVRDARGTRPLPIEDFVRHVDLGPRRKGGTRAVFVRCRPRTSCVVRGYDFRGNATYGLSSFALLPGVENAPAVWKDRFAFTRTVRGRRLGFFASDPLRRVTRAAVVSSDLRGSRLAYVTHAPTGAPGIDGAVNHVTTVRVARLPRGRGRVRSCFIARGTGPDVELSNVVLTATHVLWLRRDLRRPAPTPGTVRRQRLPARGCPAAGGEEGSREIPRLRSFAVDRGRIFYTTNNSVWEATDPPLTFAR